MLRTHTWSEELAPAGPYSSPKVGRELLGVLVLEDELGDCPLAKGATRPHGPHTPFFLHQLAVDQRHQLPLHGPTERARAESRHAYKDRRQRVHDVTGLTRVCSLYCTLHTQRELVEMAY